MELLFTRSVSALPHRFAYAGFVRWVCVWGGEGAEAWAEMKYVESVVGQLSVPVTIIILWVVVVVVVVVVIR